MATSPIPPMLIELQLETAKITAQMAQLQNSFTSLGQTVEKQNTFFTRLKATASGVFAGNLMMQGLQMLKSGIQGAVADAQEYEIQMAKSKAVIEATGAVAGVSAQHIRDQAAALESVATVDQNVISQGENVIATFTQIRNVAGAGNDIFDQTTKAALDMAAVLKTDMPTAAMQLGKALNDPIRGMTMLQRSGVSFTAQQKAQVTAMMNAGNVLGAQKVILAEVNREFGGAAKAAGDTFAGAVFRAKDAAQDFARDLVTNVQPILLEIGKTIAWVYDHSLKPLFSWISKNKEAVAVFAGILLTAVAAFKVYKMAVAATVAMQELWIVALALSKGAKLADIAATEGQTGAMVLLNAVMNANPIAIVVTALAALAAGFVLAWNHSETFRKVAINAFQGILSGVSFAIRALADFVSFASKYLIMPFKILLTALSHLPGVGKYAKAALEFMGDIPNILDSAADKVDSFSSSLDKLANKKITIPGFGGKDKSGKDAPAATAPTTITAETLAKQKALNDAIAKIEKDFMKSMAEEVAKKQEADIKAYDRYNEDLRKLNMKRDKDIADAHKRAMKADAADQANYQKDLLKNQADFENKKLSLLNDYTKKQAELRKKAAEQTVQLEADAIDKQKSVIQKSVDQLKSAFASGLSFNIKDNYVGGALGLVNMLRTQLTGARDLQKNAAELAGKGYTQSFIEQIVAAGPTIGNQMASSILRADSATQTELQSLYASMTDITDNGMNDLATSMNSGGKLASQALMQEYAQVAIDLKKSLATTNSDLMDSLATANADYQDSIAQAMRDRDAANSDAAVKLAEALANNAAALKDDLAGIQEDYDASLAEMGRTLQQDLIQNQKDYQDAITKIAEDTKAQLLDLGLSLDATMAKIRQMQALAASNSTGSSSGKATFIPAITSATSGYVTDYSKANTTVDTTTLAGILKASGGTTVNVSAVTNASPYSIADSVTSAIKYGAAVTLPSANTSISTAQGVANKLRAMGEI